jgi:serine/threonine protein kinase
VTLLTDLYTIGNTIDTFAPGHYARVYEAVDRRDSHACAFKVMRTEHVADGDGQPRMEAMAFINEADLLVRMAIVPSVVRLLDCGYISSREENPRSGEIESYGLNVELFRQGAFRYAGKGWRPYLALELLPRTESLLYVMKPNAPGVRWRLPTEEGLDLASQFANVLREAHRQHIVYLDHKLEHVYWNGTTLRIIDWNSSRLIEHSPHVFAQQVTADIHNLCVGVLYPVFTGLSPQKGSLMAQPADQAGVESRYTDVNQLDFGVEPTLSRGLQDLLQHGARRQLTTIEQFSLGLGRVAAEFGWDTVVGQETALKAARSQVRTGLAQLRQGHEALRIARDILRDALIMDEITDDFELELRRLLGKINDMLNSRVIP